MARVTFTATAQQHMRELHAFIARRSPAAAKAMARRIRSAAGLLGRHPLLGRTVPEFGDSTLRELLVDSYRVLYRYDAERDRVHIIAIMHSSRMLASLIDPEEPL